MCCKWDLFVDFIASHCCVSGTTLRFDYRKGQRELVPPDEMWLGLWTHVPRSLLCASSQRPSVG